MFKPINTVEPRYNEVLGTMKITLLYQVSHYISVKKQRNIKSCDQQNYLVIRGFCYIQPLYNEVPLYFIVFNVWAKSQNFWCQMHHSQCKAKQSNAVVTPLRKAASYEQRKINFGSSP